MTLRKRLGLITLIVFCLTAVGCWNQRDIEDLGFVLLLGVDRAKDSSMIQLTVHIAKPFAITGAIHPPVDERSFWLVSSTGRTMFEAVRNFLDQSSQRLFWPDNNNILIGEDMARQGIGDILDWLERDGESRPRANIIIVKGARAEDMMQAEFETQRIPAEGFQGILRAVEYGNSTVVKAPLFQFLGQLRTEGMQPVAIRAELVPRPTKQDIRGQLKDTVVPVSAALTGAAAFKGDRLVGWLDQRQTRGCLWIKGGVKSGIIVAKQPGHDDKLVSLEIIRASSRITPEFRNGRPVIRVQVRAEANLGEAQSYLDPVAHPELWTSMERRMATVIRNEIRSTLTISQQDFQSDIFGFGAAFHRDYPQEWQAMKYNWNDIFPDLEVEIDVRAKLRRSGLTIPNQDLVKK